ncbi:MAG TPA: lipoyl(octanoyl) transferase [Acidobacteriaceae bacterium]|nr:lipoyl(octanoyl) transferase [Acidobacteriaceae bacterium]
MFIHLLQLGRMGYAEGLAVQARVVAARKAGLIGDTLLLLEHPPVITLGRNASRANILASDAMLAARGVELHEINRGGDVTYHGPGQLIGYPIVDLRGDWPGKKGPHLGPVDFVRMMEEALIRACADFGVMAKRIPKCTGVWTFGGGLAGDVAGAKTDGGADRGDGDPDDAVGSSTDRDKAAMKGPRNFEVDHGIREKKLAAIGIHVSQAVTSHGFALNVTTDLRDFAWIIPCGITDRGVTSLELEADAAAQPTMERAANAVARHFGRVFGRQMLWCESLEQLLAPGK